MRGNAPVPIVAWLWAVWVGEDPTVASVNHTPPERSERRYGQVSGHRSRTSHPDGVPDERHQERGGSAPRAPSSSARPSGAWKPPNPSRPACVGAMSASVTGSWRSGEAGTTPGPYQNIGIRCA